METPSADNAGTVKGDEVEESRQPFAKERHARTAPDGNGSGAGGAAVKSESDSYSRRRWQLFGALGIVVVLAAVAATLYWFNTRDWEWTDDAFIDARQHPIAAKVSGYITDVLVGDNEHVEAGKVVARIDQREFIVTLKQAKAQLAQAEAGVQNAVAQLAAHQAQIEQAKATIANNKAQLVFAEQDFKRYQALVGQGNTPVQTFQQAKSTLGQRQASVTSAEAALAVTEKQVAVLEAQKASADANVAAARAQVAQAELNISYTDVKVEEPGRIVQLSAGKGQLAQTGQALMTIVPDRIWVTANFKETQLDHMRPGQPVDIEIDAYPNRKLKGHVDSIQAGSGTAFSLLPAQNATGNFVKVTQRVPVKIVLENVPPDLTLGPGMSVVPEVKVK
jgi:membrane fusion protein (multidrug efflux system)